MDHKRIIVVGGGAAGMLAAGTAGKRGLDVVLLEKNSRLGRKLLITGKGRCNITNNTDVEGLIDNVPINSNFLYSAFYTFSNTDLLALFEELGLEVKVERGGRVFPSSDKALDVVKALEKYISRNHVKIQYSGVKRILFHNDKVTGVQLDNGSEIDADAVIVATGGISYPGTGSTGDGYKFAKEAGHTVTTLKPSLVPLEVSEPWIKELQGLSLKNISITILDEKAKKLYTDFGEMLFTHFGVSGPVILSASSHMRDIENHRYMLRIDLKPALSEEQLDKRIQRDFEKYSRKHYSNALDELLPKKLIPVIIKLSGIPEDKPVNQITRQERFSIIKTLKELTLNITGFRPIEEAIITSGGINVDEVNPSTMESKIIKGLYFAGEVLDVDAYTGGFNLQIAFSTGYLAGYYCLTE
ncbi:NAD(P)/FAD-dependent oxidoreductase [Petroclostridium sp. X23]|uniref:NAD(P)/FAD-dependent oxidoreductase n=1 Tax=Petroclostridium sp. X23 TaxID=3045146 RepID=UPI0024AE0289|nr:NAD(P)/FAD-dependent oxidoreductase [Petroclostridium sp. X23]WHH61589.1 NAD(P)/FAD-dependent oxidoreductase [Petroclostridium sp. X23]